MILYSTITALAWREAHISFDWRSTPPPLKPLVQDLCQFEDTCQRRCRQVPEEQKRVNFTTVYFMRWHGGLGVTFENGV